MFNGIRVILPKKYDLVVGDTFQLFYRGVIEAPNPYAYSILVLCEKGKAFPRYFEFTPEEEGEYNLSISVYDADKNLLGKGETTLKVVCAKKPKKPVNILVIGDSITADGTWVNELNRRIKSSDGEPKGLGFDGVNFVGTCKKGDVCFEGYGGWNWSTYTHYSKAGAYVECPNKRTNEDQHSLWRDEHGYIWQLETINRDYLKFMRYKEHKGPDPTKGVFYHEKNAADTSPIKFTSTILSNQSTPFYDLENKKIDIKKYMKDNGIDSVDYIYIMLGYNGTVRRVALENTRRDYCKYVVNEGKELVKYLKEAMPNVKIKVMSVMLPSSKGGLGSNYGAQLPLIDYYDLVHYMMELSLAYQEWCLEDEYKDFMEFINVSGQFDSEYGFPHIDKPVNVRSKITEWFDTNAIHPTTEGKMQIADAAYRNLVAELAKQ